MPQVVLHFTYFPVQVERLQFQLRENKLRTTSKVDLDGTVLSRVAQAAFLTEVYCFVSMARVQTAVWLWTLLSFWILKIPFCAFVRFAALCRSSFLCLPGFPPCINSLRSWVSSPWSSLLVSLSPFVSPYCCLPLVTSQTLLAFHFQILFKANLRVFFLYVWLPLKGSISRAFIALDKDIWAFWTNSEWLTVQITFCKNLHICDSKFLLQNVNSKGSSDTWFGPAKCAP